jgi:hypothetical protein
MIFSALLSFLGGSAFRMIWGEISNFMNKKQDHEFELQRLKMQQELDAQTHQRMMESLRLQSDLGIKTIEAKSEADLNLADAGAFSEAMKHAFTQTGNFIIDAWNGGIRPAAATIVLVLWLMKVIQAGGVMDGFDQELVCAILGFFFADRSLGKKGR